MDLTSVAGLIIGTLCFLWAMTWTGSAVDTSKLKLFVDMPSVVIVFGGGLAGFLTSFKMNQCINAPKVMMKVFLNASPDMKGTIEKIMEFGVLARRDGVLALEEKISEIKDPYMAKGFRMLVDGVASEAVEATLDAEIEGMGKRHEAGQKIMERLGYYAPAMGMLGTLVGLVLMLANLNDPSKIGGAMAVALLTTYYGAHAANLLCIPFECKLAQRSQEEALYREMVKAGVLAILAGESPRQLNEKLLIYLPPAERAALEMK